jgi:hypothetical protein
VYTINAYQFNNEIKLGGNEKYIESSIYTAKKEKFALTDNYRQKQHDVTCAALQAESVQEG